MSLRWRPYIELLIVLLVASSPMWAILIYPAGALPLLGAIAGAAAILVLIACVNGGPTERPPDPL